MDGVIIINKPQGITSHGVVNKIRSIYKTKKVGHTGTLDPNATGVLPILIGNGTKISKYLIEHDKEYIATIKLGEETNTLDIEGKVIYKKNVNKKLLNKNYINNILDNFKGKQNQIPPIYSAIKIDGKKLYEYAREGKNIEIKPREIEIYNLELENVDLNNNELTIKVECSKGTYIRTLCKDISVKLNTVGYMKTLERIKVNDFTIDKSINLDELENNRNNVDFLKSKIIKIDEIFKSNEKIVLNENKIKYLLNGVNLTYNNKDGIYKIYNESNIFLGLATVKDNLLKRDVILI